MAKKKDPSITYLNRYGFNCLKHPREGIEPMDLIGKDQTTQWLGALKTVWTSSVPEPQPSGPQVSTTIVGQKTDQLDLQLGLKILTGALAAFGATMPAVDIAYHRARKVQFSFTNVTSTTVSPLEAGNYLAAGTLKTKNPVVEHYLKGEDSQAFLIVEVLKSDSISVTATDEHGMEVGVDIPAIEGVLGTNVKVKLGGASNGTLTYTGPKPITFGFRINEVEYDGNKWSLAGVAPSPEYAFGPGGTTGTAVSAAATPILLGHSCRVSI